MAIIYLQGWFFASWWCLAFKPYLFWNKNTTSAAHIFICSAMPDCVTSEGPAWQHMLTKHQKIHYLFREVIMMRAYFVVLYYLLTIHFWIVIHCNYLYYIYRYINQRDVYSWLRAASYVQYLMINNALELVSSVNHTYLSSGLKEK